MFKKILITLLFLSSVAYAGPLDILDATGGFDARMGQEYFQADGSIYNNLVMNMYQGVRFEAAPWIEPYVGFNKAQATYILGGDTESLYGGVKNKTWLAPFVFGLEYRSTVIPNDPSVKSVVGYVAVHNNWDLRHKGEDR